MSKKQILLINDMAGYGKVATAAMLPILSYFGHPTYNLPTALVSNTLDYGKFNILETTDYIKGVFPVWKQLGFSFDAIATGFIASERQAAIISRYCREQAAKGATIFVDPIMGDEGKLYNGVTPATINSMREMLGVAHLCYPNYTEACYLTGRSYSPDGVSRTEAESLLNHLCKSGRARHLSRAFLWTGNRRWRATITRATPIFCCPTTRFRYTSPVRATSFRLCLWAICLMTNRSWRAPARRWMPSIA